MTDLSKEKLDLSPEVKKKRGPKKSIGNSLSKGVGLFDHIKHIRSIQDPNYFKGLNELDLKSFNHFMILKALSMNPLLLDDVSILFRYFDKIPSAQFYQLLIGLIPADRKYYPWVKSKINSISNELIDLFVRYYDISKKEANEYIILLSSTEKGKNELKNLCEDFGLEDKEIELALKFRKDEDNE